MDNVFSEIFVAEEDLLFKMKLPCQFQKGIIKLVSVSKWVLKIQSLTLTHSLLIFYIYLLIYTVQGLFEFNFGSRTCTSGPKNDQKYQTPTVDNTLCTLNTCALAMYLTLLSPITDYT